MIKYKYLCCNKSYQENLDENLKKHFFNTYKFFNHDINKFILLLQKGVYPYEYMDDWEKFNETSLPEKKKIIITLTWKILLMPNRCTEIVCKNFKIKNLGEYHDLHLQSYALLLADAFESFRNMCLEIYELDPGYFFTESGLAWQAVLKNVKVRLVHITDIDLLFIIEKGIIGGIYINDYDKNK